MRARYRLRYGESRGGRGKRPGWEFHTIDGDDLCRVSAEPADFPVYEGTGDDDRTFWWRYPTGTKAVTDDAEQQRIIRRRFGIGGGPNSEPTRRADGIESV